MTSENAHLPGILEVADQIHQEALKDRDKALPDDRRSMQTQGSTQTLSLEIPAETLQQIWQQGSLQCPECPKSFMRRHELKYVLPLMERCLTLLINISSKHFRTHNRSFKCTEPGCAFRDYRLQDLDRHISSSHKKGDDQFRTFCEFSGYPMAGKGFSRRDNYVRHVRRQHRASLDSRVS